MKSMKRNLLNKNFFSSFGIILLVGGLSFAQTSTEKVKRNSPFAPNPRGRLEIAKASNSETQNNPTAQKINYIESADKQAENSIIIDKAAEAQGEGEADAHPPVISSVSAKAEDGVNKSSEKKNLEVAKNTAASAAPSEIYRVGAGDILFVSLQNAPAKESTYFTVSKDGTIDYPLAGEMVPVAGLTTDEIVATLQGKIKLYQNPDVSVKVREHNSHSYTVLGMVEKSGEKFLQREAYPLLVVKAEAVVQVQADRAVIKRSNSQTEIIDLKDNKSDDVLIYSGDVVEFSSTETANANTAKQFFYIGGEIVSGGQKDFLKGMTLTQAILASGGMKKTTVRKVIIRRKNQAGMLAPTNYDLKAIKDGKTIDPEIEAGDTIEIGN